jgi:hypothetical protein
MSLRVDLSLVRFSPIEDTCTDTPRPDFGQPDGNIPSLHLTRRFFPPVLTRSRTFRLLLRRATPNRNPIPTERPMGIVGCRLGEAVSRPSDCNDADF